VPLIDAAQVDYDFEAHNTDSDLNPRSKGAVKTASAATNSITISKLALRICIRLLLERSGEERVLAARAHERDNGDVDRS